MNPETRPKLVDIARWAIIAEVQGRPAAMDRVACITSGGGTPFGGAFVTLRSGQTLRGCIGTFSPLPTLEETVEHVARLACHDPRFESTPLRPEDLAGLRMEISVLGSLRKTANPLELRIGTDGILIRKGNASGCFLPQVAAEARWSAEEFLRQCCRSKARLPPDAWKQDDCEVYLFTTETVSADVVAHEGKAC